MAAAATLVEGPGAAAVMAGGEAAAPKGERAAGAAPGGAAFGCAAERAAGSGESAAEPGAGGPLLHDLAQWASEEASTVCQLPAQQQSSKAEAAAA